MQFSNPPESSIARLQEQALEMVSRLKYRAHAPYSGRQGAALAILEGGAWIPGVRVESASFGLSIDALTNAYTTCVAVGEPQPVAFVLNSAASPTQRAYLQGLGETTYRPVSDSLFVCEDISRLPSALGHEFQPSYRQRDGMAEARAVRRRAYVPQSHFTVGAVARLANGLLVPGVNVEHPDWGHILCAERNLLGTLISYALGPVEAIYLSCDGTCTPCGACRQLLAEHFPATPLFMDAGLDNPAQETTPAALLPGFFSGASLLND